MPLPALVVGAIGLLKTAGWRHVFSVPGTQEGAVGESSRFKEQACVQSGGIPKFTINADGSTSFTCVMPSPQAVPETPKTNDIPIISTPPRNVYQEPITAPEEGLDIISTPIPQLPPRRLEPLGIPEDVINGVSTATQPGKVVSVRYSVNQGMYGSLLHEPIDSLPEQSYISFNYDYANTYQVSQEEAATKFFEWILAKPETDPEDLIPTLEDLEEKPNLNDMAMILLSKQTREDLAIFPIFGLKGIADFIADRIARNTGVTTKVRNTIPVNYATIQMDNSTTEINEILENLEVSGLGIGGGAGSLSDILGINDFPATLPSSLITKIEVNNDKLGQTVEPGTVTINNLTQLIGWLIERVDELFGQWQIPIEIKDIDATTPGDQPKGIVLPNLAEYAGETFLMQYSMLVNMEALISMCTRTLLEAGQLKQQGYVTYQSVQAIMDYLGFKVVDKKTQLPLTFTPGKEDLAELLQDSTVNVVYPEFGEKVGLIQDLHRFRKACGIIDAQSWRKVDVNGNLLNQVMEGVLKGRKLLAEMIEQDDDNWDNFKENTEQGYSKELLHPTPNKPYGKPLDQRPKIKELGTTAAAEEINNLPTPEK